MLKGVLLFLLGFVLLIKGGDFFVDGAVNIANKFHLPKLLIGATIVSIGTTLPEVMVSATSALQGLGEISYGNAIGSIICNTSLIAAITVAVRPGLVDKKTIRIPVLFFFGTAIFYAGVAIITGHFSRIIGIILLLIFVAYSIVNVRALKKQGSEVETEEEVEDMPLVKSIVLLVLGAALIAVGADLLVDNGTIIAKFLGVPDAVIGLTFIALGTSLPELVTAITSLIKGHSDLSLGNIIGANLFNMVLVTGVSATLAPFSIPMSRSIAGINSSLVIDIPVMFLVMLILTIPPLLTGKLKRRNGIILLAIYAAFTVGQFLL